MALDVRVQACVYQEKSILPAGVGIFPHLPYFDLDFWHEYSIWLRRERDRPRYRAGRAG